jgi:hypothetical protein
MSAVVAPAGSSVTSTVIARLDRLVLSITRHERRYISLAITILCLVVAYGALTSPLWFDEFFTLFISRLSSLPEMLKVMPADSQPPLQYLLVHASLHWFGTSEFTLRLPAMLAWLAAGLLTWRIVRVHGAPVQALFALVTVLGATTGSYWLSGISLIDQAFTARPYELVLAFTALAFACWQIAILRQRRRIIPLCGLTFAIAGVVLSHHFGIIQIGAFLAAGEITRFVRRRRLDIPVLAAAAIGLLPLLITLPLAHQTSLVLGVPIAHSTNYWAKPSLADLACWPALTPWLIFLPITVLACLPVLTPRDLRPEPELPEVPVHEKAAAIALALLPPAQLLLAILKTGYFFPRYAIGAVLGLALLFAWTWPRTGQLRAIAQPALAALTLGYLAFIALYLVIAPRYIPLGRAQLVKAGVASVSLHVPGDLPIVDSNACDYLQEWWYAPPDLRQRLVYLSDLTYAEKQPAFVAELTIMLDRSITPVPVADYSSFLAAHPRFYMLRTGRIYDNWLPARLARSGWHVTKLSSDNMGELYLAEAPGLSHP